MVSCQNITLKVGDISLLKNISMTISPGELVALIGPNGAGKSTLLKVLSGLLSPSVGSVQMDELSVSAQTREEQARRRGVMSQRSRLDFPFAAFDVVMLGRSPHVGRGRRECDNREITFAALDHVGAAHFANRSYPTLSGGESQKIDLARALAQIWEKSDLSNRYLFLDEPTASLDLAREREILTIVRQAAREGVGVLAVLHDLNTAAEFADRIVLMKEGAVVAQGNPWEVLTPQHIESVFEVPATVGEHPHHTGPLVLIGSRYESMPHTFTNGEEISREKRVVELN